MVLITLDGPQDTAATSQPHTHTHLEVLGPLLSIIYFNDLNKVIISDTCKVPDDTGVKVISPVVLQGELNDLHEWANN